MSSPFLALGSSIYGTLSAGTALTTALGGTSIYYQQAPDNKANPVVVWSYPASNLLNITASDMRTTLVFVRVYADSPAQAGTIDGMIDALLDKKTLSVTGYTNWWTAREQDLSMVETPENGAPIYMCGGYYRVNIDA